MERQPINIDMELPLIEILLSSLNCNIWLSPIDMLLSLNCDIELQPINMELCCYHS